MEKAVSLDSSKVPGFVIVNGQVTCHMGGHFSRLKPGEELHYKKHGSFILEYAGLDYGIIHHVTRYWQVVKIFIPVRKRMLISNGQWECDWVHWDSYQKAAERM
jgi:hypothetical protein